MTTEGKTKKGTRTRKCDVLLFKCLPPSLWEEGKLHHSLNHPHIHGIICVSGCITATLKWGEILLIVKINAITSPRDKPYRLVIQTLCGILSNHISEHGTTAEGKRCCALFLARPTAPSCGVIVVNHVSTIERCRKRDITHMATNTMLSSDSFCGLNCSILRTSYCGA